MSESSAALERRAMSLRQLAQRLDRSLVRSIGSASGPDTWVGAVAVVFEGRAADAHRRVDHAVAQLHDAARMLDRQASQARAAEMLQAGAS